jgi:putative transposase
LHGCPEIIYAFIQENRDKFEVAVLCEVLGVSRSGFYDWLKRDHHQKVQTIKKLKDAIARIFNESRSTYGSPRIWRQMLAEGFAVSKDTVCRIMREMGLRAKSKMKFKNRTTDSNHRYPVADNVLNRKFDQNAPNKALVGDVTFIATKQGWLYLAAVMDLCTRKIVGWAMHDNNDRYLTMSALRMALNRQKIEHGCVFHSDRGSNYACYDFQSMLLANNLIASMSRAGDCFDNAVIESFFHSLKTEFVHHCNFETRSQAKAAIFEWIEVFYNRKRMHSKLNYKTPIDFEATLIYSRAS